MKITLRTIVVSFCLVLGVSVATFAQDGDNRRSINDRQQNQRQNIREGVREGDLSRKEADRLIREQARIARQEQQFRSDGEFTRAERGRIQSSLNRSARHIRRAGRN